MSEINDRSFRYIHAATTNLFFVMFAHQMYSSIYLLTFVHVFFACGIYLVSHSSDRWYFFLMSFCEYLRICGGSFWFYLEGFLRGVLFLISPAVEWVCAVDRRENYDVLIDQFVVGFVKQILNDFHQGEGGPFTKNDTTVHISTQ